MPRISNSIKSGDFNEFDHGVKDAAGAVCALTESAAQVGTGTKLKSLDRALFCYIKHARKYFILS